MNVQEWAVPLTDAISRVADRIIELLPSYLGFFALLLIGWVVARLLRAVTVHITSRAMGRLARTDGIDARVERSQSFRSTPMVTGRIVFWTVFLFFLAAAVETLGLAAVSSILARVTAYLPRILAGVIILFIGFWIGEFLRGVTRRTAAGAGLANAELLGRSAQVLAVIIMTIVAIDQIGISSTMLVTTLATVFAATFGAAGLAFGLGARQAVSNIIASHYVQEAYRVGDFIKIGDLEGRIVEIRSTSVMLESAGSQVLVPAQRFSEENSELVAKET
jgi:small-conductance mechanosensitive channel